MSHEEVIAYLKEKRDVIERLIAKGLLSDWEVAKLRELGVL